MKKNIINKAILICILLISAITCKKPEYAPVKLDTVNTTILTYLESNPSYTTLVEALKSTGVSTILGYYGTMTFFAPTNDAFKKYFERKGISGLSAINQDELIKLLRYHIYNKAYLSSAFTTGSLPVTTVSGDYIAFNIDQGLRNTILNGSVRIDTLDILATNGYINVINDVLEPPSKTIASWLKSQSDYSIMSEAFTKTGIDTSVLNKISYIPGATFAGQPVVDRLTVFVEPDSILKLAGISSFEQLAEKYSDNYVSGKTNYSDRADSLNIMLRYHIVRNKYFISDLSDDYIETLVPESFVFTSTSNGIGLNYDKNTLSKIGLLNKKSDRLMSNGILHTIDKVMRVFNPGPQKISSYFAGTMNDQVITLQNGTVSTLSDQFVNLKDNLASQQSVWWLKWGYSAGTFSWMWKQEDTTAKAYCYPVYVNPMYANDHPIEPMQGLRMASWKNYWVELTTKKILKGTYTLYLYASHTQQSTVTMNYSFSLDDVKAAELDNFQSLTRDLYGNDTRFWTSQYDLGLCRGSGNGNTQYDGNNYAFIAKRKLGVYTFNSTTSHKFRIDLVDASNTNSLTLYKLGWEPVN